VDFVAALDEFFDGCGVVIEAVEVCGGFGDFGVKKLAGVPFGEVAVIAAADVEDALAGAEFLDASDAIEVPNHNLIDLHPDAAGGIDADKVHGDLVFGEIFVGRFAGALPEAVVVKDKDATALETGIKVDHLVEAGFVPIGVEAKDGYFFRNGLRNRFFDLALDEMHPAGWVAGGFHVFLHFGKGGVAPIDDVAFPRGLLEPDFGEIAADILVVLGGFDHAGEGIEEIEVAIGAAKRFKGKGGSHRHAATPDAAFNESAGDVSFDHVADSADDRVDFVHFAGHGKRTNGAANFLFLFGEVLRKPGVLLAAGQFVAGGTQGGV
jgi:hypothetical protein